MIDTNIHITPEHIASEYNDFLQELWTHVTEKSRNYGFLWFDRCTFDLFYKFAMSSNVSTGPPIAAHSV